MAETNIHPEEETQHRRSTRIVQAVPLTVTGVDALGRPFQERTSTLIINCHGCRYQSKHYVLKNMWVTLEVPHNEPAHAPRRVRGRVTWIQRPRTARELFQIGLELEVPGNVWGIVFPPPDWFPFPETESSAEIPAPPIPAPPIIPKPDEEAQAPALAAEEPKPELDEKPAVRVTEPDEDDDNVRVLPLPAIADSSLQTPRQSARSIDETREQIEDFARESVAHAVAAETRTLLAALQAQLQDAADKSAAAAVAAQMEHAQREASNRMSPGHAESLEAVQDEVSREVDRRLSEARLQIDVHLTELQRAQQADFEKQIQSQLELAVQKFETLTDTLGADENRVRELIGELRQTSTQAGEEETRRWQEQLDRRSKDIQAQLAQIERAAAKLEEEISTVTTAAGARWRRNLEADLSGASALWQGKKEELLEELAKEASARMMQNAEPAMRQVEREMENRINAISNAQAQLIADAQNMLSTLRAAITNEAGQGEAVISQLQQSVSQLESRRNEFSDLFEKAAEGWVRRGESILETQSSEMERRAESSVARMSERLQPMLEAAGQDTITALTQRLEGQIEPQVAGIMEVVNSLAAERERAEKALEEHEQRVSDASERNLQELAARGKEIFSQIDKEFEESARVAVSRWAGELDARATETSHNTFEALFKSADWYEKKVQNQMQTTMEKGLDQAATRLREKAAEMSALYASELDHSSRSFIEHAQAQMSENARESAEQASQQIAEAGEAAAAKFTERAAELASEQSSLYASKAQAAFEQSLAHMEAIAAQVRSKLEADARGFAVEFQRALSLHTQQSLAQGKQELATQIDQAKDLLTAESHAFQDKLRSALQSLAAAAMDEHKQRLENASNSWLLTTVAKLSQQSETLIDQLAEATEKRMKTICANVYSEMGETLRQRLAGIAPAGKGIPPEGKK